MTSSPKAEVRLSYARTESGNYEEVRCAVFWEGQDEHGVTTLDVATRLEMLIFFVHTIRSVLPNRVAILHGEEPHYLSQETLQGILDAKLTAEDLLIGS